MHRRFTSRYGAVNVYAPKSYPGPLGCPTAPLPNTRPKVIRRAGGCRLQAGWDSPACWAAVHSTTQ